MKSLLLVDKLNWAYDSIAKSLQKYNDDSGHRIDVMPIKKNADNIKKKYKRYDNILVMGWQTYELVDFLPKNKTMIGIHSHHSWDKRKTKPDRDVTPPYKLIRFLNKFYRVNTVSQRLFDLFSNAGVEKIYYTPNGVDSNMFKPVNIKKNNEFHIGYSGSKSHDWRKGVTKFIEPAAANAKVKIKIAMLSTGSYVPLEEMPKFYSQLDTYVCASSSEGFSLSVLEAASCGLPVISTKCGGCTELIIDGYNGFLVDRDVNKIAEKINILKFDGKLCNDMGINMRKHIVDNYCWSKKSKDWLKFIKNK